MANSNKLIPVLTFGALGLMFTGLWFVASRPTPRVEKAGETLTSRPVPGGAQAAPEKSYIGRVLSGDAALKPVRPADADTHLETLNTVVAKYEQQSSRISTVIEDNKTLARENRDLRLHLQDQDARDRRLLDRMRDEIAASGSRTTATTAAASSTNGPVTSGGTDPASQLEAWKSAASQWTAKIPRTRAEPQRDGGESTDAAGPGASDPLLGVVPPLGYAPSRAEGQGLVRYTRVSLSGAPIGAPSAANGAGGVGTSPSSSGERPPVTPRPVQPVQPWFTIPENATLARSTTMTLLVGRVPIDGRVNDPMQFKLVIGKDNLAASAHRLPDDLSGIIVSGIAIGDMALSCVEGQVQSLTFVFDDGTIRTVSNRSGGAMRTAIASGTASGGTVAQRKLGWLSNDYGSPCLPGTFVTNAPAYLADIVGVRALGIAGAAYSASQTTQTASVLGGTSTVTGSRGQYVVGRTVTGATDEVANWLLQRLKNSFDAVVVEAGIAVSVHIDTQIDIDYDPNGRRLEHAHLALQRARQIGEAHGLD